MIISYPKRSILSLFFLLLLLLSLLNLSKLDQEISIKKQTINETPVTIFEPKKDKIDNILVFVAHGFAGSSSFMKSIAISLANTGYKTITYDFLGHGRHSKPYSGSITNENGATQLFVEQTSDLIDYFLNKKEQDELIIIGHSMASDIIFRVANTSDKFIGSIGVSNYTDQIKKNEPNNVLIINGVWEKHLRNKALNILESIGITNPQENILYGSFSDGSARKVLSIKNADHVGILYSENSQLSINDWVNKIIGNQYNIKTNNLGIWAALLFISVVGLFFLIVSFFKKQYFNKIELSVFRCILGNIFAAVITPALVYFFSINFTEYPAHSYLINHLFLYAILVIIINKIPLNLSSLSDFKLQDFTFLFCFFAFIIGSILDNYVSTFYLTHSRIELFFPLIIGCIPICFLIDSYYTNKRFILLKSLITKSFLIISLSFAIYFKFDELFLLGYAIILLIAFWVVYGFLSHYLMKRIGSFLSISFANGFTLAWTLAIALPMYIA